MKKSFRIIISQIFFLIAINLIVNKAFFSHIHILGNGKIIVHSHPYSKKVNHTHTQFSFYVIEQSNRFENTLIDIQTFNFDNVLSHNDYLVSNSQSFGGGIIDLIDKRGPPTLNA